MGVGVSIALYFGLRFWRLHGAPTEGLYDEGVYLSLMKLMAEGVGLPYRDFFCVPPPGGIVAGALLWKPVGGDLLWMRVTYILLTGLALVPLYALARRLFGPRVALATLFLMATTPAFCGWLGRHVYLDLPLNLFVYTALWLALRRPESAWAAVGAGIICAVGFLIKATGACAAAAVAGGLIIASRVRRKTATDSPSGWAFSAGAGLTIALIAAAVQGVPNLAYDTLGSNAQRAYDLASRPREFLNGVYQMPLQLTLGWLGVAAMLRRGSASHAALGWFAVLATCFGLIVPRVFFWRFLTAAAPVLCIGVSAWWLEARPNLRGRRAVAAYAVVTLGVVIHATTLALYYIRQAPATPASREAVSALRSLPEPVFSANPIWAVASGRAVPKWRFSTDTLMPREIGIVGDADFVRVLRSCPTVVLDRTTERALPDGIADRIRTDYATVFRSGAPGHSGYIEILVRNAAAGMVGAARLDGLGRGAHYNTLLYGKAERR